MRKLLLNLFATGWLVFGITGTPHAASHGGHASATDKTEALVQVAEGIRVELDLQPQPLKPGDDAEVMIIFAPQKDVALPQLETVDIVWSMPDHGHNVASQTAIPLRENGHYASSIRFPMAGSYQAVVQTKAGGAPLRAVFLLTVGSDMDHHDNRQHDHQEME